MNDEKGILSIDFLAGFTIFILAFIWVVSMIPGLMIGLQSYTIDYDAVAYRTGVILVEDPGSPAFPVSWEGYNDFQKSNMTRLGLAVSKDYPNILSEYKVNRFFCTTVFNNVEDYRTRAIFGDYPYGFNFTLIDVGGQNKSVGDVLPNGYGYMRRIVKIKGPSNATINNAAYTANPSFYFKNDNVSTHVFSILIDNAVLQESVNDPAYQIDPAREQIIINITDLRSTIREFPTAIPPITRANSTISLKSIKVIKQNDGLYSPVILLPSDYPYIDGNDTRLSAMPANVANNITLRFDPSEQFFNKNLGPKTQMFIALEFEVSPPSSFLNNTQVLPNINILDGNLTFNNPNTLPLNYNYTSSVVTQPKLRDAVFEVAIWSGTALTSIGPQTTPTPTGPQHTIQSSAGSGGSITPVGPVSVFDGLNQTFTITPNTGYHILDVLVDGVSQGAIATYTFNNVIQDHTIAASFAINTYTITATSGPNGAVTPAGVITVTYGATPTYTITPVNAFYHIADVLVDGTSVGTVNSYTFPAVAANRTITATFALGPAPAFTSITPNSGPTAGGTPVTIIGTNFASGGAFGVTIGGAPATSVVWVDSSQITAVTPAGTTGARDVVITNNDGQIATAVGAYTYVTAPVAGFSTNPNPATGIGPLTVTFTDTSTGGTPTSWDWDFGDGSPHSTLQNPLAHTYNVPGSYTAQLTVSNAGGSSSATRPVTVQTIVIMTFTSSTTWTAPAGVTSVEYLVVAGGGGGGSYGGGGGAGGLRTASGYAVTPGNTYTVTVGAGGARGTAGGRGTTGGNSVFAGITSNGGGGGGSSGTNNGRSGGSGGGGERSAGTGGTGTVGQGTNGATGRGAASPYYGGGGGGASAVGTSGSGTTAGNGGAGTPSSISGVSVTYAGGGGGSATSGIAGTGGSGGGGNGAVGNAAGSNGAANTGGGGGGGGSSPNNGGNGGSGIVIIKYTM